MSRTYSKRYILVFRFLLIGSWIAAASMLRAQVPEIENEIRSHRSEKELLIQGRYMLLDSLKAGNIEKVVEVRNYLMTLSDDLLAFLPSEYFLILYLTGEFELLEEELRIWILDDDSKVEGVWQIKGEDYILPQLKLFAQKREIEIRQSINDEVYFGMQNEFLQLYLTYLLKETYSGFDSPDQQEVNEEASHYLERYPNSEWNSYIRKYIRIVYGPSSWFGGLAIGGGFMGLTQDLKTRYGNTGSFDFEIYGGYKQYGMAMDLLFGITENQIEQTYTFSNGDEIIWRAGESATIFRGTLNFFTYLKITDKFTVVPIAGIGLSSINPSQDEEDRNQDLEVFETGEFETYSIGGALQWRFSRSSGTNNLFFGRNPEENRWYLQLRYMYSEPRFQRKLTGFAGVYHNLTLSIGGFGRPYRRKL